MDTGTITTVDGLFARLGGIKASSETLRESRGTVRQWKLRKRLPARKYPVHAALLQARGIVASPRLWGVDVPEAG